MKIKELIQNIKESLQFHNTIKSSLKIKLKAIICEIIGHRFEKPLYICNRCDEYISIEKR